MNITLFLAKVKSDEKGSLREAFNIRDSKLNLIRRARIPQLSSRG